MDSLSFFITRTNICVFTKFTKWCGNCVKVSVFRKLLHTKIYMNIKKGAEIHAKTLKKVYSVEGNRLAFPTKEKL